MTREIGVAPASKERLDHVLQNYLLALAGVDQCAVSAADDLKNRLAANLERAERAYADAAADGLAEWPRTIDIEVEALAKANERSRLALHSGTPIIELLGHLERGTDHANRVIEAALERRD
jgi:hypothetical protein